LWKELVGHNTAMNVNHVSLAFTGIDIAEQGQKSIEGFLKHGPTNSPKKRPRNETPYMMIELPTEITNYEHQDDVAYDMQTTEHQSSIHGLSYTCSRCGKTFRPPESLSDADDEVKQEALSNMQLEHQDLHFAEDLVKSSEESASLVGLPLRKAGFKPGTGWKKSRKEPQGLDKYFAKK
jgi:DNA polymerase eta